MKRITIKAHWNPILRIALWLVCTGLSTAVAVLCGARWAGIIPAVWLVIFVPMVLMPIIRPSPRD